MHFRIAILGECRRGSDGRLREEVCDVNRRGADAAGAPAGHRPDVRVHLLLLLQQLSAHRLGAARERDCSADRPAPAGRPAVRSGPRPVIANNKIKII